MKIFEVMKQSTFACKCKAVLVVFLVSNLFKSEGSIDLSDSSESHSPVETLDLNLGPESHQDVHCQWIVITGDSNNRFAYHAWAQLEQEKNHSTVLQAEWKPNSLVETSQATSRPRLLSNLRCDESTWRWVDKEMVLLSNHNQTCRIVTLKFLAGQTSEVTRLDNLLEHSSHYCKGYQLENVLPAGFSRPQVPDTLWFSHGLWGLPNQGNWRNSPTADQLNCHERFAPHVRALKRWMALGIRSLTWQTLFPVNGHPTTTNPYLDWDYACQVQMASNQTSGLLHLVEDLYQFVKPRKSDLLRPNDCHFKDHEVLLKRYLDRCCGGWDYYWAHH